MSANLHALFDAVADLPADAQLAALLALTDDEVLIKKVLRMCDHAQANKTVIASAIAHSASDLNATLSNELKAGDTLDAWKLIEKIGQGGMGTVFLAERADGHFQQTVAVKVMHGLPTAAATARLAQERQILAGLTHPNIARLFDGGATPNGQPYLVLEYIKGLSIDAYCQSKGLGFIQMLELMLPICDAVAIAHQRLIIHCDIKPGNILVSQAGRPALLDFGIASLAGEAQLAVLADATNIAPELAEQPAHFTQTTMRGQLSVAYTPRYASPEQKASKAITTATDIYSLGRVLEELCALDPVYRRGAAHGKARLQSDELQAIVDRACADIPAARYGSAQALAADIKNLLHGAKVDAAAIVPGYSSRKWISQHWLKAAAAMLFLAMVGGFSLKVIAEKNRAELQAVNAETERRKAEIERKKAETERLKAEAERAIAEAERAKAEAQRLTATQARKVAEVAQQQTQIAKNDADKQRDVAEDSRKQALSAKNVALIAQRSAQESEQRAVEERNLVIQANKSTETVNNFLVSIFRGVDPIGDGNRNASARDVVIRAEKRLSELKDVEPKIQAQLFRSLGSIHNSFGDVKASSAYLQKAAAAYATYGEKYNVEHATVLASASVDISSEDTVKSTELAHQAVAVAKKVKIEQPKVYARALNALFASLNAASRPLEAKNAADELESFYRSFNKDPWADEGYISFRFNVGFNQYNRNDFASAEATFAAVLDKRLKQTPRVEGALLNAYTNLANSLAKQGKNDEAERMFTQGIANGTITLGYDSQRMVITRGFYADFLRALKRFDAADTQLKLIEGAILKLKLGGNLQAGNIVSQALLAEERGRHIEAIGLHERAAKIYIETRGEFNGFTARRYERIARVYVEIKQYADARRYAERAIAMRKKIHAETDDLMLAANRTLAFVEAADGKLSLAITVLERIMALDVNASLVPADSKFATRRDAALAWQSVVATLNAVGDVPARDAARAKAISYAEAARDVAEKSDGVNSANYQAANALLSSLRAPARDVSK